MPEEEELEMHEGCGNAHDVHDDHDDQILLLGEMLELMWTEEDLQGLVIPRHLQGPVTQEALKLRQLCLSLRI